MFPPQPKGGPSRALATALIFGCAWLAVTPALTGAAHPPGIGGYNFVWAHQVIDAFRGGDFYPRWLPGSFEGLGSPTFYFYPPLTYWIAGGVGLAGFATPEALTLAAALVLAASGLAMYAWLSWRNTHPLLGSILYIVAPYHLSDFYTRGALAEFAAFMWLPLIALGIEALRRRWGPPLLALAYAGLILTHLPSAVLVSAFLAAPLGIRQVCRQRDTLAPGLGAGLLGLMIAAVYLLPALTLQRHISTELLWSAHYQPETWFVWKPQPLWYWLTVPTVAAAGALLALRDRSIWLALTLAAALGALGLIPFIWDTPPLAKAQFPWRLLMAVEFAAITALVATPPRLCAVAAAGFLLFLPYAFGVAIARHSQPPDFEELARLLPDAPEYLPVGFDTRGVSDLARRPRLAPYRDLPRSDEIEVSTPGSVTLGRAAFPIWRITRDGEVVATRGPLLTIEAKAGRYRIERVLTKPEITGGWLTALGLAALIAPAVLRRSTGR